MRHPLRRQDRLRPRDLERLRPQVQALATEFHDAWSRFVWLHRERVVLIGVVWSTEDATALASFLPRLAWLVEEIESAWQAMTAGRSGSTASTMM